MMSSEPNEPAVSHPATKRSLFRRLRPWLAVVVVVAAASALLTYEGIATKPVRESVRSFAELVALANRADLADDELTRRARELCSQRYLAAHDLRPAPDGGLVGLPRNLHKNFEAWREHGNVWIRPTDRVGPVYQFVYEFGTWKFDGPVGIIGPQGDFVPAAEIEK